MFEDWRKLRNEETHCMYFSVYESGVIESRQIRLEGQTESIEAQRHPGLRISEKTQETKT
jgi:hypothetical protein